MTIGLSTKRGNFHRAVLGRLHPALTQGDGVPRGAPICDGISYVIFSFMTALSSDEPWMVCGADDVDKFEVCACEFEAYEAFEDVICEVSISGEAVCDVCG